MIWYKSITDQGMAAIPQWIYHSDFINEDNGDQLIETDTQISDYEFQIRTRNSCGYSNERYFSKIAIIEVGLEIEISDHIKQGIEAQTAFTTYLAENSKSYTTLSDFNERIELFLTSDDYIENYNANGSKTIDLEHN